MLETLLRESGACAWGAAEAQAVPEEEWRRFEEWIANGHNAGMAYMERHADLRRDPRLLLPEAKTVISVAFNYRQPNPYAGRVATYALGEDYHRAIRKRLKSVVKAARDTMAGAWRICIDSAPILERYWAQQCRVGTRSPRHGNIVVKGVGSMVFLAEILTTCKVSLPPYPGVTECESAEDSGYVCPTGALLPGGSIDGGRCINYLTIEHRGAWNEAQRTLMRRPGACNAIFGCDICQLADPANQTPHAEIIREFKSGDTLPSSPISRATPTDLLRNILPRG